MKTGMGGGGPMAGMGGGDMDDEDEYNGGGSPFGNQNNGGRGLHGPVRQSDAGTEPEPIIQVQGMKLGKKKKGRWI